MLLGLIFNRSNCWGKGIGSLVPKLQAGPRQLHEFAFLAQDRLVAADYSTPVAHLGIAKESIVLRSVGSTLWCCTSRAFVLLSGLRACACKKVIQTMIAAEAKAGRQRCPLCLSAATKTCNHNPKQSW